MHNTPPPTFFSDGSLAVELRQDLTPAAAGSRWLHMCKPDGEAPYIAHVRVLQGNGDTIYQDLHAEHSVIRIELQDDRGPAGDLTISGDDEGFKIDSDQELGGPHAGAKGRRKYKHPGKGNSFYISRITIDKDAHPASHFEVNAPDAEEEYKVMIWHKGDTH